jgi:hypothetical protein
LQAILSEGPLTACAGEIVQRLGDDPHDNPSVVTGALHHLDFGDQQRVLRRMCRWASKFIEDGDLVRSLPSSRITNAIFPRRDVCARSCARRRHAMRGRSSATP